MLHIRRIIERSSYESERRRRYFTRVLIDVLVEAKIIIDLSRLYCKERLSIRTIAVLLSKSDWC